MIEEINIFFSPIRLSFNKVEFTLIRTSIFYDFNLYRKIDKRYTYSLFNIGLIIIKERRFDLNYFLKIVCRL